MLCWLCQRTKPDRGGLCHACRQAQFPDSSASRRDGQFKLAVAVAGLLSVAAGLLSPAVVSRTIRPASNPARLAMHRLVRSAQPVERPIGYQTVMVVEQVKRKVYPYSIVPGGAQNLREAKLDMTDPAVQAHYAGFRLGELRQENLTVYVS
jgi:hypothetical protein